MADYNFKPFRLLPDRRLLLRDGESVVLGSRAFDLLTTLVEGRNQPVTKEELLRRVWPGGVVEANNLTVTMSALRKTLGETPDGTPFIRTVSGRGYQFVAPVTERSLTVPVPDPEMPSVAVLPFVNMTGDAQREFFGDGLAEDIIVELSHNRWLTVIARNSSFSYRATNTSGRQIARELGVRYVLEGSLRQAGSRLRVTARLMDAASRAQICSVRCETEVGDLLIAQEEVTTAILTTIRPAIYEAEQVRSLRKPASSIGAWDAYQRAVWFANRFEAPDYLSARLWLRRAMELDPSFAPAYYGLALVTLHDGSGFMPTAEPDWQARGEMLARKSTELEPRDSSAFAVLGLALMLRGEHAGALEAFDTALDLNPSDAAAHHSRGSTLIFTERPEEGLAAVRTSLRLSPRDPRLRIRYLHLVLGHVFADQPDQAEAVAREVVRRWPDYPPAWRILAIALADAGKCDEAQAIIARTIALQRAPFDNYAHARMPWYGKVAHCRVLRALRRAGWTGPADD